MHGKLKSISIFTLVFCFGFVSICCAQQSRTLLFQTHTQPQGFPPGPPYSWQAFGNCDDVELITPGGTVEDCFSFTFEDDFQQLQSEVVGTWVFTNAAGDSVSVVVPSLQESDFPQIVVNSPIDNQVFFSGETIEPDTFASSGDISGVGLLANSLEVTFAYVDGLETFQFSLLPGVQRSEPQIGVVYRSSRPDLIAEITGDTDQIEVNQDLRINAITDFIPLIIVLGGDVNQDASVDLLDVAPFVDLINNNGFLEEADINRDGQVDLLDVAPFVELLTG